MKIPLFYSDLFIEKNVGSTSEREELLNIILDLESNISMIVSANLSIVVSSLFPILIISLLKTLFLNAFVVASI